MIFIIIGFIIIIIMATIIALNNNAENNIEKQIANREERYKENYNIPNFSEKIYCMDINDKHIIENLYIWKDNNTLKYISANSLERGEIQTIQEIKFDDIICFNRVGDITTTMNIKGGEINIGKAILGNMIAGDAGAVLMGKERIRVENNTTDNRVTFLIYKDKDNESFMKFDTKGYDILLKLIPLKEYSMCNLKDL